MTVTWRREGDAGLVELANPPVNAMGLAVRQGLLDAVRWAENEPGLSRVIVSGQGRAFAAGGDAREFDGDPVPPHLPDVLDAIEASTVPWIAAAHGVALGGGAELMLACRYRIAAPDTKIGLPEVTLGVVPGAGGTQRLPRFVGLGTALDMIANGKPVGALDAQEMGLVDAVADDPVAHAMSLDMTSVQDRPILSALDGPAPDDDAVQKARATAHKRMRGQIAPQKAIDLVALSATTAFRDALARERQTFIELRSTEQAKALRHIFFAERAAKAPGWLDAEPLKVERAAVVGGGTMGAGIAYALLLAGIGVTLLETDVEGVERAKANIGRIMDASARRGLLSDNKRARIEAALTVTDDYGAAAKADLAIEAAFESMEVKKTVFGALEKALPADAVLATNTSYLDVNEIAAGLADPSRLMGLHFFAPAHIMKLLEIVQGDATSHRALATGFDLAKRLRKVPVLSRVCDGFIGNRILARYREAADTLLMDGTNPWELDEAMVEFGYAMGPYEAQDLSGLDIAHANRKRQGATRDPDRRYIPIGDRMVAEGRLGKKAGVGWYRYPGGGGKIVDPLIEDLVREEAHFAKVERCSFTDDEIRHRLVLAMINEAADILAEGIAQSAADIDLVTVFGYGFPRWRGGLMHYADTLGVDAIVADLRALEAEDPIAWKPSAALLACAQQGIALRDYRPNP
ncbi:MAG: enoyl-CoA hydratase/isomerase family protein [Roseitalea sp.]|nr:enoyl-CoA hydratase/isomerase family protein [Roseitalea sp.]MBO6950366.1 enoyl-CoA hydratase/isomerase family protein [Rhizobiaceae bacterium]MBO6591645.1 enoyl-CoA hydratase/isomerase family protein [Roseitalea sp.]MBO6599500.1 enoyl-CoA hydratase/isomerase family protein [Roseitalea sp.]MBO6612011.1 enoyl-CoA hydratase/isomerase family protein [Roseitalea sp.]